MRMFEPMPPRKPGRAVEGQLIAVRDSRGRLRCVDAASTPQGSPYREVNDTIRDLAALIARKKR